MTQLRSQYVVFVAVVVVFVMPMLDKELKIICGLGLLLPVQVTVEEYNVKYVYNNVFVLYTSTKKSNILII